MSKPENVTAETNQAVRRFCAAHRAIERTRDTLNRDETELLNAINALGKWITPADAKPGEMFNIWYGDGLLAVKFVGEGTYEIGWRTPPSAKVKCDMGLY